MNEPFYYFLLLFNVIAMGLNIMWAINAFRSGHFFIFGTNVAFAIYWILKMVELVFDK